MRKRNDRSEVVRYIALLVLWLVLLIAAPYLIYLATTGKLIFAGDLAIVSFLVVSGLVSGIYYLISRVG
jgi:hypothetical protein